MTKKPQNNGSLRSSRMFFWSSTPVLTSVLTLEMPLCAWNLGRNGPEGQVQLPHPKKAQNLQTFPPKSLVISTELRAIRAGRGINSEGLFGPYPLLPRVADDKTATPSKCGHTAKSE
jgi:hypothetical protein